MHTTKRKFNALLNGLGNKSTTSLSSDLNVDAGGNNITAFADQSTSSRKRRDLRTSSVLANVPSSVGISNAAPTNTVIKHQKVAGGPRSSLAPIEKPKYAPWDRLAFLDRLRTYSNLTDWTPKPTKVNEVEWAKRGWVCQKFERLRCCLCNVEILVKLNKKDVDGREQPVYIASQIEDALVDKYAEMIVTSHADNCLWKLRGCDDKIFKLSLNQATPTLHALRERYDGLCAQENQLPYMHNLRTPDEFNLETVLIYLTPDFFTPTETIHSEGTLDQLAVNKVAITLALFGWRSRPEHISKYGASQCETCFRTLGLWLFKSKEIDEAGRETSPASMSYLDVVEEHREYCPWKNATSQNGEDPSSIDSGLAAWQVLLRLLKNNHYLKRGRESSPEVTRTRPATLVIDTVHSTDVLGLATDSADAASLRDEKDKQRWARLKRVKSLFDTKSSKRMSKSSQ